MPGFAKLKPPFFSGLVRVGSDYELAFRDGVAKPTQALYLHSSYFPLTASIKLFVI